MIFLNLKNCYILLKKYKYISKENPQIFYKKKSAIIIEIVYSVFPYQMSLGSGEGHGPAAGILIHVRLNGSTFCLHCTVKQSDRNSSKADIFYEPTNYEQDV